MAYNACILAIIQDEHQIGERITLQGVEGKENEDSHKLSFEKKLLPQHGDFSIHCVNDHQQRRPSEL